MAKDINYVISFNEGYNLPNEVIGLGSVHTKADSRLQALTGFLAKNGLLYLANDLKYRFLFEDSIDIKPVNKRDATEERARSNLVSREGQIHYLSELFGHKIFDRDGEIPIGFYIEQEREKLAKMPDNQVFAIYMKYRE